MDCTIKRFDSGMHYVIISPEAIQPFLDIKQKRVLANLNNTLKIHCALMSKKEHRFFIYLGKKVLKDLGLKQGDTVTVEIEKDDSEVEFEFPEELKEVLNTDMEARQVFDNLTDGNKRSLMYLVTNVKSSDKRIERSLKIADQIKIGITSARKIKL